MDPSNHPWGPPKGPGPHFENRKVNQYGLAVLPYTAYHVHATFRSLHVCFGISRRGRTAAWNLFVQHVWLRVCMRVLSTQGYAPSCHLYLNWDSPASFQNAWPSAGILGALTGTWTAQRRLSLPIVFAQEHSLKSVTAFIPAFVLNCYCKIQNCGLCITRKTHTIATHESIITAINNKLL